MSKISIIIAIDGPAASGKGTLGRKLAAHLDFAYLDTGALYRATGRDVLQARGDLHDAALAAEIAAKLDPSSLADPDLRSEAMGHAASVVAAHPAVRDALLAFQQGFAEMPPAGKAGAILDGRDIGTIICPQAPVKLFITATAEIRAGRRFAELTSHNLPASMETILADIRARDARDSGRSAAPLRTADDAVTLDTSAMDAMQVFAEGLQVVEQRLKSAGIICAKLSRGV